jgi:hypothetical protein
MTDLRAKRPKVLGARVAGLRLSSEERYVMAQIDGQQTVDDLIGITGLAPDRLEHIVNKLAFEGALELAEDRRFAVPGLEDGGTASLADFAAALGMDPTAIDPNAAPLPSPSEPAAAPPKPRLRKVVRRSAPMVAAPQIPMEPEPDAPPPEAPEAEDKTLETEGADQEALGGRMLELEAEPPADALLLEGEESPSPGDDKALTLTERQEDAARIEAERNYRQIYESRWHPLPVDARVHGARNAHGSELLALCFDHDPRVIAALLENHTVGLDHVRLIAFHHRNGTGLEIVARRQDWLRDLLVERRLLRNPMIGEIVLGRVVGPKRLFATYKLAIDRDIPELTRIKCRGFLRQKWQTATSEERADILLRTEARCLTLMTGCTFDAKTTAILCGRPMNSVMFVQMVTKFPASPPGLLAHLWKQPFVRKNPSLKKMLLGHPNMPGDVKRNI